MYTAINHPLIKHKITWMRKFDTDKKMFRELLNEISILLMYEASRDLPMREIEVTTPLMKTKSFILEDNAVAIIPILRAGLGMTDILQDLLPIAKVGHIGLFRNETTLEPVEYYKKLPKDISERHVFVVDPMLATGGSLSAAVTIIKKEKPLSIRVLSIISAPVGLARMEKDHPDVMIFTAQVDEKLNEKGYILPGLGDAGDRLFGTL
ncbi:MAG TPA: uracil phosphoribosyltransferase [bacterium]|nr:uracil phosphoribosyltransferase [bacterium]